MHVHPSLHVDPHALMERIDGRQTPVILDVRTTREFVTGHVPGARHLPFWQAFFRAGRIPATRREPLVVYCGHGPRAQIAAAALRLRGFRDVRLLRGHWAGWRRAGLRIER